MMSDREWWDDNRRALAQINADYRRSAGLWWWTKLLVFLAGFFYVFTFVFY